MSCGMKGLRKHKKQMDNSIFTKGFLLNEKIIFFGLNIKSKEILFKKMLGIGNEQLSEYLAVVTAVSYCVENHIRKDIYTCSPEAFRWCETLKPNISLPYNDQTKNTYKQVDRAEKFMQHNVHNKNKGFVKLVRAEDVEQEMSLINSEFDKIKLLLG